MHKSIVFVLLGLGLFLIGGDEFSRRGSMSASSSTAPQTQVLTRTQTDRVCRNMYNTQVIVIADDQPVYITVQLESIVHIAAHKVEFVLRLWEVDKLLTTKKVSVNW